MGAGEMGAGEMGANRSVYTTAIITPDSAPPVVFEVCLSQSHGLVPLYNQAIVRYTTLEQLISDVDSAICLRQTHTVVDIHFIARSVCSFATAQSAARHIRNPVYRFHSSS